MALTVVNGYLCMNGCDAAKARTGQDPHAAADGSKSNATNNRQTNTSATDGSAVIFGGALASLNNSTNAAPAPSAATHSAPAPSVNLLV